MVRIVPGADPFKRRNLAVHGWTMVQQRSLRPLSIIKRQHRKHRENKSMYRVIAALFLLAASAVASSAQGILPSIWRTEQGAILKFLSVDSATGNVSGLFINNPSGPCPAVAYDLTGRVRGSRVIFQTSRTWSDCRATAVWSGRYVSSTGLATRWIATSVAPNGRVVRTRGRAVFQRI